MPSNLSTLAGHALQTLPIGLQAAPVKVTQVFPEGKTVYGFTFDKSKFKWVPWGDLLDPTPIAADAEYTNIIVPTVDTVRYTFLIDQLVRSNKHCLLVGPTGTGKTAYIKKHLQGGLPDSFVPLFFNFSAQTSANMTQVSFCTHCISAYCSQLTLLLEKSTSKLPAIPTVSLLGFRLQLLAFFASLSAAEAHCR